MYEVKVIRDGETYSQKFAELPSALDWIENYILYDYDQREVEFKLARVPDLRPVNSHD